jgi:hypothetical protein
MAPSQFSAIDEFMLYTISTSTAQKSLTGFKVHQWQWYNTTDMECARLP